MSEELKAAYLRGVSTLERIKSKDYIFKNALLQIWTSFEAIAWYESLINHDIEKAKNAFYNCALTDIELCNYGYDLFSYKRNSPLYAALSDNRAVQQEFSNLEYIIRSGPNNNKTNKEVVEIGKSHIYIDSIIKALNKDLQGLKENIDNMKSNLLTLKKNKSLLVDLDFFEGLVENNPEKIESTIIALGTKHHKSRNRHSFFYQDIVSQPAMGYAKIAWINGYDMEFAQPLIYNSLLPCKSVQLYKNEIAILKEVMTLEPEDPNHNGIRKQAIT